MNSSYTPVNFDMNPSNTTKKGAISLSKIDSIQNLSTILMPLNSVLVVVHATLLQKLLSFKFCRFSFDFLRDDRSKNHRNYSRHFHVRSAEKITNEICCVWCCYLIREYKVKR